MQITKIQTIYKLLQITILRKKLPTYQHEYPVLLRKSAPMFSFPGMSSTLKEYSCTATAHRTLGRFGTTRPLDISRACGLSGE